MNVLGGVDVYLGNAVGLCACKTHDRGVVPLGGPHTSACMNVRF